MHSKRESVNSVSMFGQTPGPNNNNLFLTPGEQNAKMLSNSKQTISGQQQRAASGGIDQTGEPLENRLQISDLELLKQAFDKYEVENEQSASFDRVEFTNFLLANLQKGTKIEYEELFDNIDVTRTGVVNWDGLTSYILQSLYETDDKNNAFAIPNWKPVKNIANNHRDSIRRVEFIKNISRYLTISKEGTCCMYDKTFNITNGTKVSSDSCKTKDLWITDYILLQNVNKIALGFTTKEIAIYEMTTKLDFNCQYRITHLKSIPLCIDYWFDVNNPNDSILLWGDTLGEVHMIFFNSSTIALFERPSANTSTAKNSNSTTNDNCLEININDIKDNFKNASYLFYKAHSAWVRQVKWASHIECALSCAATSKESVCLGWYIKKSAHIRATHLNIINGGVNAFDYDEKSNLIATGNQNTVVNLFNPYVSDPNGILKGHSRIVLAVKFMPSRSQLISFSADKVLRIWNVPLQVCIQRISNVFPKGPEVSDVITWFDELANRLFISFRYTLLMMEIKPEVTNRIQTHENSVVSVRYNRVSNQVITMSLDGSVYMWLIESGQRIKSLNQLHGPGTELSCMEFDDHFTKIYTAGNDGNVSIWDFNGFCVNNLVTSEGQNSEISQVLLLKRRVIAVGWKKSIEVFRENEFKNQNVSSSNWEGKEAHTEDILCCAVMTVAPLLLATGSFDGEIVIWNSSTEFANKHLVNRKRMNAPLKEATSHSLRSDRKASVANAMRKPDVNLADTDNDFGSAILCLRFLNSRVYGKDANLISCGGNGIVRFWEVSNSRLIAEFTAHSDVSSIIMEVDSSEKYLATGDINGLVKVWNLSDYCTGVNELSELITNEPKLVCSIQSHHDIINSIDFCSKNEFVYVMIASLDCSVSLNDLKGNLIGIFGQEQHWKIDTGIQVKHNKSQMMSKNQMISDSHVAKSAKSNKSNKSSVNFKEDEVDNPNAPKTVERPPTAVPPYVGQPTQLFTALNENLNVESTFEFEDDAFIKNTELRYNPWSKTILGKSYQETRQLKRDRRQPQIINTEEFQIWDKTGQAPGGLYGSLEIVELDSVKANEPKKPDFMINPHKYFRDKNSPAGAEFKGVNKSTTENPKHAFDEKSLFPKFSVDQK